MPGEKGADKARLALTLEELQAFLSREFPQSVQNGQSVLSIAPYTARCRMSLQGPEAERHLRPGGTVSGPAMFALADYAFYAATLAMIGPEPMTVTVNLSIAFLRRPEPVDLIAEARILKLGRRMSLGDVLLYSEGVAEPVAQASVSYAIPPKGK